MRNVRLEIAYEGTNYAGWQRQAGAATVQEELERSVALICQTETTVHGSGRTDSGVHAWAQTAHVRLARGPAASQLHRALNSVLPEDIRVLSATEMPADFHARFSAIGKRYVYLVSTRGVLHPLLRPYVHQHGHDVDLASMRAAARHLLGTHDFLSFAANPGVPRMRPTIRTLRSLHLRRQRFGFSLWAQGDGFLYNMVRILAGTLLEVGKGRVAVERVPEILAARDRTKAGPTLPARGLALVRALYPTAFRIPRAEFAHGSGALALPPEDGGTSADTQPGFSPI